MWQRSTISAVGQAVGIKIIRKGREDGCWVWTCLVAESSAEGVLYSADVVALVSGGCHA